MFKVPTLRRPSLFGRKSNRKPVPTVFPTVEIPLSVALLNLPDFGAN